jgi:hypothetical protein
MRKLILRGLLFGFLLFISFPASADVLDKARLSLIHGDVLVQTLDTENEWVPASINLPLLPGYKLWVPKHGRAEVQFHGKAYLRADEKTAIDITRIKNNVDENIIQVAISTGRTFVNYKGLALRDSVFKVDTPIISAMAYSPSKFSVEVYENGCTEVSVIEGIVYVEGQHGNTRVSAGNMLSIRVGGYAEISPRRSYDQWVSWNLSRDYAIARASISTRYLPPELEVYSSDFDEYGRWIYVSDYGYVWCPTTVAKIWAPYRIGRWVWINGDYVWISYEPWGWVPYHYGRWAFRVGIGWFWVPPAINAVFWSPGFVAWIYTPMYVSWVPLSPEEVYYGYGYYGPYSVNLTEVNIKTINIKNVYVNAYVENAVTVVHRETFLTGKPVKIVKADGIPDNPFKKRLKVSPGRPDIKPVKASYSSLPMKVVTYESLPPKKFIENTKTTNISERPVAVKKDVSVFKTNKKTSHMPLNKIEGPESVTSIHRDGKNRIPMQKESIGRPDIRSREGISRPYVKNETKQSQWRKPMEKSMGNPDRLSIQNNKEEKGKIYIQREISGKSINSRKSITQPYIKQKEEKDRRAIVQREPHRF